MDATIRSTFWTDARIEELPADQKLSLLWLITNPARSLLGFTQVSTRRFLLDTSLPITALEGACKALPTSFEVLPGGWYFARNFLRHQFGHGGRLSLKNKVIIAAARQARALPEPLQRAFLEAYPELRQIVLREPMLEKGDARGIEGHPPSVDGVREGEGEGEGERERAGAKEEQATGGLSGSPGHPDAVLAGQIADAYPRRTHRRETLEAVLDAMRRGHSGEAILLGTRRIAAVVAGWTESERLCFLKPPPAFFRGDHWLDDPEFWRSKASARRETGTVAAGGSRRSLTPEERAARLGGRA